MFTFTNRITLLLPLLSTYPSITPPQTFPSITPTYPSFTPYPPLTPLLPLPKLSPLLPPYYPHLPLFYPLPPTYPSITPPLPQIHLSNEEVFDIDVNIFSLLLKYLYVGDTHFTQFSMQVLTPRPHPY